MSGPDPALSRIAAAAFATRQAQARCMVRDTGITAGEASQRLSPWLAIACLAGADLPELDEPLAQLREKSADGSWSFSDAQARALLASQICPRSRWAPLLARARDAAIDRADAAARSNRVTTPEAEADLAQARALSALAHAFIACPNGRHPIPAYRQKEPV